MLHYAQSDKLAECLYKAATKNFFMDNHSDLEYLQSRAGKQAVVDTHIEGIVEYVSRWP